MSNVGTVSCISTTGADSNNSWAANGYYLKYDLSFLSWPSHPMENNFFSHTGNPKLTDFTCDISDVVVNGGSNNECILTDIVNSDVTGVCVRVVIF